MRAIYFVRIKRIYRLLGILIGLSTLGIFLPAMAQMTSDGTTNTIVNANGNNFTILNGIEKGNNLFHSFSNFSVPTKGSATFDLVNTPNINTIFSRITGGSISNIDGLIQTVNSNNPVSLFLMNPAGIMFGANASLNIGGSFVGTTANSIKFADGVEFSTKNTPTLLTISAPIGLEFENPGDITAGGIGHKIRFNSLFAPLIGAGNQSTGLGVNPNNTLALIGGNVNLNGAVLSTTDGRLELGSVANGTVNLTAARNGWGFGYETIQNFGDIRLSNLSALDATGQSNAYLQLVGRNIALNKGTIAILDNQQPLPGGTIRVQATELLSLTENSLLLSDAFAGSNAEMTIIAPQIYLGDTGIIGFRIFGIAQGKSLTINADNIKIDAQLDKSPINRSSISVITTGKGNLGTNTISTKKLMILNGGMVQGTTSGSGDGGELIVNAEEILIDSNVFQNSQLLASTMGNGNAGSLILNTAHLKVTNGAFVSTSTLAHGRGGNLRINATESVEIGGQSKTGNFSTISSAAPIVSPEGRAILKLPPSPTGVSGDIVIVTPNLKVLDSGVIRVSNQGSGDGGTINITAQSINLNGKANISANTFSGKEGNISLKAQSLLLQNQSSINTTASLDGNGGNITIDVPIIVGLGNSDIIANAFQGRGGNINIKTQGIFGLAFSNTLNPTDNLSNDITASSKFNINGTVQINNIGVDPSSGLVQLPTNITDSSQQIASGCSANKDNRFVVTGRGGVPQNPSQSLRNDRLWNDLRNFSTDQKLNHRKAQITTSPEPLIQATSWYRNADGKIELIADKSPAHMEQLLTCAGVLKS
jgi:filamentous hemagglutinin family protein